MEACLLTGLSSPFGGYAQFLVATFREQHRLFDDPVSELRIGIFTDSVVTVHEHACLSEVLDLLEHHGASFCRRSFTGIMFFNQLVCVFVFSFWESQRRPEIEFLVSILNYLILVLSKS